MPGQNPKTGNSHARQIRTRRDFAGASTVVRRLSAAAKRDDAAEQRLQSLLHEMERYDDTGEDMDAAVPADEDYPGPRRRWSDDVPGLD